ncbi:apc amino acid permease [Lichtheimia corymbifera JMRC:FSU:9682]|uniref:Apc amino acid permease n=1 Tax=Lichtheimia corymbifera JMRC:FSU:9682 TaxID=1263082 RepID=A0A068RWN1_9FUNG|nr:apc amino acid permease [Lichtheimia corymbifera JMRC:FSU:9682]
MSFDTKNEKAGKTIDIESVPSTDANDQDAQRLEHLGYKQEFKREISLFVLAGFSFSTMAVLPNWLIGFAGTMDSGGPMSLFWGFIVAAPFLYCIALAMAELFSAFPVCGGVYSWSYLLAGPKWGPLMSWVTGYMIVAGLLTANMTVAYSLSEYIIALSNILNVHQINNQGANVGLYIAVLLLGLAYCSLGIKFNGYLNRFMIFWVLIGTVIVVITLPAMADTHPSARWVFTEFRNATGWGNDGLTFLLGMLQAGWTIIGYENGAHLAEGTVNSEIIGPKGILISVTGAIAQSLILCVATLFSIQDVEDLMNSSFPVATLFVRATNTSVGAFFMVILIVAEFGCLANTIVALGNLMWAMARDGALPNHKFWYKLEGFGDNKVPIRIYTLQVVICIVLIMPTFGSEVYWSAIMSTAVICANIAYGMPYVCRLIWKRKGMVKGPFDLGRYSIPINIVAVLWILFFAVILCIPTVNPVNPETMNWSCLMLGAVFIFSLSFWFLGGKNTFKGPDLNAEAH